MLSAYASRGTPHCFALAPFTVQPLACAAPSMYAYPPEMCNGVGDGVLYRMLPAECVSVAPGSTENVPLKVAVLLL